MEVLQGDLTEQLYTEFVYRNRYVGVDIETSGLNKELDKIACVQFYGSDTKESALVRIRREKIPDYIIMLLETTKVKKIFHHAPFDLTFLMRDYGITPKAIRCTKVAAKLLDRNKNMFFNPHKGKTDHGLAALVYSLCGVKLDKSTSTSNWFNKELTPEQLLYAENDVKYLPQIWAILQQHLRNTNMLQLAKEAFDYLPAKIRLELLGYNDIYGYE